MGYSAYVVVLSAVAIIGLPLGRNFSGAGTFAIADGQLTLKKVWFGTRTATSQPEICELTFVRP